VHIDVIETVPEFMRLEDDWNAVYDADPDARVFLSWTWLSGWLSQQRGPWLVLAVKDSDKADAPYVAFFPLRIQTKVVEGRIRNEINMAGNFTADYTGIVCRPELEHKVIPALARHLKQMNWARLNLENVRQSEPRLRLLLAHFPNSGFRTRDIDRTGKVDGIDNNICPFAALPPDWDAYLDGLSANTRQKIRRLLKRLDAGSDYRISHATAATIDRDLDTLLRFWEIKWTPRKGDLVHGLVRSNRAMLTRSFHAGLLFLPTLWLGERPLAALATLIDPRKRTFLFYMTGRDESFDGGVPPGLVLHAHSIRHAIAGGFIEYDFLRGNEPYKYSFGVKERRIRCVVVATRDDLNLGGRIDRRTVTEVLSLATDLHRDGHLAAAERGYRQALDVEPDNADALHRLGQLLAARGQHAMAKRCFVRLAALRPDTHKAWLCLAHAYEALGHDEEALDAYREVVRLQPALAEAFSGLAALLIRLGRIEAVNAALLAAGRRHGAARGTPGYAETVEEERPPRLLQ
jgi:tetratricopeptide (TPR) repeat protein